MSARRPTEPARPRTPWHGVLAAELDRGVAMAADPGNAALPDLCLHVTTIHSRWFARTCRSCLDKFREGDQVRLCPACQDAFHDDPQYGLRCWERRFAGGQPCREASDPRFATTKPCS